jgi:hypothetical protein
MLSFTLSEVDWSAVLPIVSAVALILSVGLWFLKARKYIDDRIVDALKKEDVLKQVALLVKPDMVFDQMESILADRGAAAFIRERGIHVKMGNPFRVGNKFVPVEIEIEFTKHLSTAPLLTALNADVATITTKRGKNFDWIYMFDYSMSGDYDANYTHKYRLEIF